MKTKKVSREQLLIMLKEADKAAEIKETLFSNLNNHNNKGLERQTKINLLNQNKNLFTNSEYAFLVEYIKDEYNFIVGDVQELLSTINHNLSKERLENQVINKLFNDFDSKNDFEHNDEFLVREKLAKLFILEKNRSLLDEETYQEVKEEIEDNYHSEFGKLKNPLLI